MAKPRGGRDNSHRSAYQANLDRKHETRMAILRWMTENEEAPYILAFLAGTSGNALSSLLGIGVDDDGRVLDNGHDIGVTIEWWKGPMTYVNEFSLSIAEYVLGDKSSGNSQDDIAGMMRNTIGMMGTSLQAFGLGMLILKNCGPMLNGIGEMIPG